MSRGETNPPGSAAIACPACGGTCAVAAPDDACVFFHECECCGVRLRPEPQDCCVICSYGSSRCPPRTALEAPSPRG